MIMPEFSNNTKNQHFISQAEQRLNSCSPDPSSRNAEVFSFKVADKSVPSIYPGERVAIHRNMSFQHLFTLARLSNQMVVNLESLFHRYEDGLTSHANSIIKTLKIAADSVGGLPSFFLDSAPEVNIAALIDSLKFIYTYKMMNWLRNPYVIKDMLRIFEPFLDHSVDSVAALRLYMALEQKDEGEMKYICQIFKISPDQYKRWIRLLLMLLYSKENERPLLEGFVEEFFRAEDYGNGVFIYCFEDNSILLPDTGIVTLEDAKGMSVLMNLSKNHLVAVNHTKLNDQLINLFCERANFSNSSRASVREHLASQLVVKVTHNSLEMLAAYNRYCVQFARNEVFSSSKVVHGVDMQPPI